MTVTFENAAEMVRRLGNIPLDRICFKPPPGTATESDLLAKLERTDRLYELVDGTLVEKAMGFSESFLAREIQGEMRAFVRQHDLGITAVPDGTVRLLKGLVRAPDVAFFAWDKLPGRMVPSKPFPDLVPDLAVEVLSKSNTPEEIERKLGEYFLAGVRLVWIINPRKRSVKIHTSADAPDATLDESGILDGGDVLPGFALPLAELFARLPAPETKTTRRKKA